MDEAVVDSYGWPSSGCTCNLCIRVQDENGNRSHVGPVIEHAPNVFSHNYLGNQSPYDYDGCQVELPNGHLCNRDKTEHVRAVWI